MNAVVQTRNGKVRGMLADASIVTRQSCASQSVSNYLSRCIF